MNIDYETYSQLIILAEGGDSAAKNSLGVLYAQAGGNENECAALYWYLEAIEDGYVESMWNGATMFLNGEGCEKDTVFGRYLVEIAANHGSNSACLYLAHCYENGLDGFEKDVEQSHVWKKKAWDFKDEVDFCAPIKVDDFLFSRPVRPVRPEERANQDIHPKSH